MKSRTALMARSRLDSEHTMPTRETHLIQEELEEALKSFKVATDPVEKRTLLQKMRRLIAEAEEHHPDSSK